MTKKMAILLFSLSAVAVFAHRESGSKTAIKAQIIFDQRTPDGNFEIYAVNIDGTGLSKISNGSVKDRQPAYSPDGEKIAFLSERSGNEDIYVMDADGANVKQLTQHPGIDADPCWSPDAQRIVFVSERDSCFNLYTMNAADGSDVERITFHAAWDGHPAWSPDGRKIAVSVLTLDDETVVNDPGNPAKARIASESGPQPPPGSRANIYIMNADGSEFRRLTEGQLNWNVSWAPDGRTIVFNTVTDGSIKIAKMDTETEQTILLDMIPSPAVSPKVSPDGKHILFSSRDGIYYSGIDGTGIKKITSHAGFHNWCPCAIRKDSRSAGALAVLDAARLASLEGMALRPASWPHVKALTSAAAPPSRTQWTSIAG